MEKSRFQRFEVREVNRSQIRGAEYNPRKITTYARELLRKKIEEVGLVEPLIWNEVTGNLVGGHQRISILDELEQRDDYTLSVSVIRVPLNTEKELNVFLNNRFAQGA